MVDKAEDIYDLFKFKLAKGQGSKSAKPTTIQAIIDLCEELQPKNVLEIGGGTGTITYTVVKNSKAWVDVYEHLPFCREQMKSNIGKGRYNIYESYQLLPRRDYDLVIVDGGVANDHHDGYEAIAELFIRYLRSVKVVYVEGRRDLQRKQVRRALRDKGMYKIVRHADKLYNGKILAGGQEYRVYPTDSEILKTLCHWFWNIVLGLNRWRFLLKDFTVLSKKI